VLARDAYECQQADGLCGGPLQIHHKTALSRGGPNDLSNLVTLCYHHHSLKHPHMRKGEYGDLRR
jgi:5-methylcytosine-specific restriction endonuclease McrA